MMQCFKKIVIIVIPTPARMTINVICAHMNTPMNAQYTRSVGVSPYNTNLRRGRLTPLLELYSGGPRLRISRPPFSLLLVGILPSAMSSALWVITGSMPMLATATTVSPFV